MNDKIVLENLEFYAFHGLYEYERELGQSFSVDVEMVLDLSKAGKSDHIEDTVDYVLIYNRIKDIMENNRFNLLESICEHIAQSILQVSIINEVMVRVRKTSMPVPGHFMPVQVEITRNR